MAKRTVTITVVVDPTEYNSNDADVEVDVEKKEVPACEDTAMSAIDLVKGMLNGDVDFPEEKIVISCEGDEKTVNIFQCSIFDCVE